MEMFDHFIGYYHQQLVEHLAMLGYNQTAPSLSQLHLHLKRYSLWGEGCPASVCSKSILILLGNFSIYMRSTNAAYSAAPAGSGLKYSQRNGKLGGGDGVQAEDVSPTGLRGSNETDTAVAH